MSKQKTILQSLVDQGSYDLQLPRFKNPYNAHMFPKKHEHISPISDTVPDQTMTIPQLLERQRRGLPLAGFKQPIFDGEDDIMEGVDPRTLDLSERQDMLRSFKNEMTELKAKNKRAILEREQKELEAKTKGEENN